MDPMHAANPTLARSDSSSHSATRSIARGGFSRTDLLALFAALSVLTTLVITPITLARNNARLTTCSANLHQIAQAILRFADEHQATLPGQDSPDSASPWWSYKDDVQPYLVSPTSTDAANNIFACPLDRGYSDTTPFSQNQRFNNTSYVFNGVTLFNVPNIAGWKLPNIIEPARTLLVMEWSAHAPLSWHRSKTGQANLPFYSDAESVVAFTDGHVDFIKIYYDGYNAAYTRDPIAGYEYKYSGD
jgi:hypothetical protein